MPGHLIDRPMLKAQSVDETAVALDLSGIASTYITHTVKWSAGCSAGVVVVEASDSTSYAGTWSPLATFTFATADTFESVVLPGSYKAIRHRIETAIADGTVTTHLIAV